MGPTREYLICVQGKEEQERLELYLYQHRQQHMDEEGVVSYLKMNVEDQRLYTSEQLSSQLVGEGKE